MEEWATSYATGAGAAAIKADKKNNTTSSSSSSAASASLQQLGPAPAFVALSIKPDDPVGFARQMASDTNLKYTVNGWVNQRDLTYGQLGCSGFIVFNRNFELITQKSASFMEMRSIAFKQVEEMVAGMMSETGTLPRVLPGEEVELCNLEAKPDLNGRKAVVIEQVAADPAKATDAGDAGVTSELDVKYQVHVTDGVIPGWLKSRRLVARSVNLRNLTRKDANYGPLLEGQGFAHTSCTLPKKQDDCGMNGAGDCGTCDDANKKKQVQSQDPPSNQKQVVALEDDFPAGKEVDVRGLDAMESVGVDDMDEQHNHCIDLMKKL